MAHENSKVVVVGLGYVGLPLAILVASKGFEVFGIDSSLERLEQIQRLNLEFEDVEIDQLNHLLNSEQLRISNDFSKLSEAETVLICVPTPLDSMHAPDLSSLQQVVFEMAKFVKPGTLISLESTSYPGTTEEFLKPNLLKFSNLSDGELFFVFSPERVDPGNRLWNLESTPKVVSGISESDLHKAILFYSKIFANVIPSSSTKAAEMAKLLENSFRLVNISLINEIAQICHSIGIDIMEVIKLASTKPFGFLPFYPGPGIGGHCIPVDPVYMLHTANKLGSTSKIVEVALAQNREMSERIYNRARAILGDENLSPRIGVIGLAYKPNVADTRESPAINFIEFARARGAQVFWNDEVVNSWSTENSTSIPNLYKNSDLIVLMVKHDYLTLNPEEKQIKVLDCTYTLEFGPNVERL